MIDKWNLNRKNVINHIGNDSSHIIDMFVFKRNVLIYIESSP